MGSSSGCSRASPSILDAEYLHIGNLITIAPFYAMLLILLIKPYGLFGSKNIERV